MGSPKAFQVTALPDLALSFECVALDTDILLGVGGRGRFSCSPGYTHYVAEDDP